MCGIVAYTGEHSARNAVLTGLERMEYRGYDSAGIGVVVDGGRVERVRAVGGVAALVDSMEANPLADGQVAIGHTRWATHGAATESNAHPFAGCDQSVLLALNGIVENHDQLRVELIEAGHIFESETDAEVVAHLLEEAGAATNLAGAVRSAAKRLKGHFALVVAHRDQPTKVAGHRNRCPLVAVTGPNSALLASSPIACGAATDRVISLEDGDTIEATPTTVIVFDADGNEVARPTRALETAELADLDGYDSFMRKEMLEQPTAIAASLASARRDLPAAIAMPISQIVLTGCGTSLNAARLGRMMIERWAGTPCSLEVAAEWPTYRRFDEQTLVVALTQSGETADTISAMQSAKAQGARTGVITNTATSLAVREADVAITTATGLEVGVAATKTFVAQIAALAVFAVELGLARGTLDSRAAAKLNRDLHALPSQVARMLELDDHLKIVSKRLADATHALYLGRGENLPVALEGALKIKELAYLPVESCSAGEMKHGPIALVDHEVPVVMVAPEGPSYEQTLTNMHEIAARGGQLIALVTEGDRRASAIANEVIEVPPCNPLLAPAVCAVAMQALAFYTAEHRGLNPDRPRNLAKTVTVQ